MQMGKPPELHLYFHASGKYLDEVSARVDVVDDVDVVDVVDGVDVVDVVDVHLKRLVSR